MIAYRVVNTSSSFISVEGVTVAPGGSATIVNYGADARAAAAAGLISVTQIATDFHETGGLVTSVNGMNGDIDLTDYIAAAAVTATQGVVSGFSGYSGLKGTSGYSGYSSTSGYSGYSGATATSGFSGYSSKSGYSGYSGAIGSSGYSGYSGEGASGYSGYSSAVAGTSGYSGYSGVVTKAAYVNPASGSFASDLINSLVAANLMNAS